MVLKKLSTLIFVFAIAAFFFPTPCASAEKTRICLTMIVRNEGKIIERCLNSVRDVIDCISICDTGSDDNTVQVIEQFMQKNNLPGKVHKQTWKNFGYNRTLSIQAAQTTLKELGFPLANTYLLLIDADMMLEKKPSFSKESLKDDSYLLIQKNHSQSYYNTRLVRASFPWKSIGVTHEYWSSQTPGTKESKLESLFIDDRDDGGCKADKFERDIRLLTAGLEEEPKNERYVFYLAQSYKSLNQFEDSIKWYKKRVELGGWNEEVWYAKLMIGQCYEELGKWDQALAVYLDAFQQNPARAEPLQQISTYYRMHEKYNLAYFFAKQGSLIPYPKDQILFISHPVYDYLFEQDISIAGYYTPFKEEGFAATHRLTMKKGLPYHIREQSYKNMLSYVNNLNGSFKPIDIDLPLIREGLASRFNPMNPSIHKTDRGYELICRTVNYTQIGARHFKSLDLLDKSNTIITRNFLIQYDKNFKKLSQQEIIEDLDRKKNQSWQIKGLEDCRLFTYKGSTWFTCTTLDTNPTGQPQISLCKLSDDRSGKTVKVEKLLPLNGPNLTRCEKNWLPVVKNGEFQMIYSYDPLVIYKPDWDSEFSTIVREVFLTHNTPQHDFSRFSGSAPPLEFDNGYLIVIHESVDDGQRNYMHRFVFLDNNFEIQKVSKPFIFLHKGIEYCCGMTKDHAGKNLVLAIGIEDREAYLCTTGLDYVRSLLEPLAKEPGAEWQR